jgi:hypothetical protein
MLGEEAQKFHKNVKNVTFNKFIFDKFSTVNSSVASIDVFYVTALYATSNMDNADRKRDKVILGDVLAYRILQQYYLMHINLLTLSPY